MHAKGDMALKVASHEVVLRGTPPRLVGWTEEPSLEVERQVRRQRESAWLDVSCPTWRQRLAASNRGARGSILNETASCAWLVQAVGVLLAS